MYDFEGINSTYLLFFNTLFAVVKEIYLRCIIVSFRKSHARDFASGLQTAYAAVLLI